MQFGQLGSMNEKPRHTFTLSRLMLAVAAVASCLGIYRVYLAFPVYILREEAAATIGMTREQVKARFGEPACRFRDSYNTSGVWCYQDRRKWVHLVRIGFGDDGKVAEVYD